MMYMKSKSKGVCGEEGEEEEEERYESKGEARKHTRDVVYSLEMFVLGGVEVQRENDEVAVLQQHHRRALS